MKKRIGSFLLTVCLVLALVPAAAVPVWGDEIDKEKLWWDWEVNGNTLTVTRDLIIRPGGMLILRGNSILDLNGHTITIESGRTTKSYTPQGYQDVYSSTSAIMVCGTNCEIKNGTIQGSSDTACIDVLSGAELKTLARSPSITIRGGTHGVYVSGTFTMNSNCTVTGCTNEGVFVPSGGSFTMNGGTITGNNKSDPNYGGGGVFCFNGTFTMTGGSISGNTTDEGGGVAVYGDSGNFTMSGGTITGNTATDEGGGVQCYWGSTFTMNGGTIAANSAAYGGGVYVSPRYKHNYGNSVDKASSFNLSGSANIYGSYSGGDIYLLDNTITLSSTPSWSHNPTVALGERHSTNPSAYYYIYI